MNCSRVQKLIPLHVEGDLNASIANRVESHLEWCGRCNWLADEYKESQGWLHASPTPEFDETFLDDFKRGVMKRVTEDNVRPSLFASLAHRWSRRQILALAATFVVVLGMVALYFYQATTKGNPLITSEVVDPPSGNDPQRAGQPQPGYIPGGAPGASSNKRHPGSDSRRHFRSPAGQYAVAEQPVKVPLAPGASGATETAGARPDQTGAVPGASNRPRDMLRIEIQTGDPSIRIIWFAPKEADLNQSKPATD